VPGRSLPRIPTSRPPKPTWTLFRGKRKQAQKILAELERHATRGLKVSSQIAGLYAALGNKIKALAWLERAQANHEGALVWLKIDPRFDSLRGEARFQKILREMGLAGATPRTDAPFPSEPVLLSGCDFSAPAANHRDVDSAHLV
jgi:hypothetical protein